MKKTQKIIMLLFALAASITAIEVIAVEKPKNIIFMIGDGMGPAYTSAYRYYADDPDTPSIDSTVFDRLMVGTASTYPDDNTLVTDSAASATALSTGHKTYNGAIAVNRSVQPLETSMQIAKRLGKRTAIVSTSQINHATPASFLAHAASRRQYNKIADQYLDNRHLNKPYIDLMLGGGTQYFIREDRDLVKGFKSLGYQYIDSFNELSKLDRLPVMGLFAEKGLPHAIDSQNPLRLSEMVKTALRLLKEDNQNGFFAMFEGSQIDWCGHANDIACAMKEMHDFAAAIGIAKRFVDANPDTLLVVTADHSTGGLTLGTDGVYKWLPSVVKNVQNSAGEIARALTHSVDIVSTWYELTKIRISEQERLALESAVKSKDKELTQLIKSLINQYSYTGWTTSGHTSVDVVVLAYGQSADLFFGHQNNTDIANKMIKLIKSPN